MKTRSALVCLALLLAFSSARAHDYWLEPDPWEPSVGKQAIIRLLVGDGLEAEIERPFQKEITTRYELHSATEVLMDLIEMEDGTTPVFQRTFDEPGSTLIVMDRDFVEIDTSVESFLEFLKHENQETLGATYEGIDPQTPLRRRYARSIKSLLSVGQEAPRELAAKVVGHTIEIRPLQSPHELVLGDQLEVHVQYESDDLNHHVISKLTRDADGKVIVERAETDERGRVFFEVDRSGLWLIRVARLVPSGDPDFDWDTHYGTYSFIVR